MTDQNCAYCMEGDLVAAFGIKICELPSSKVYLFKEQSHKGRVIVAHKKHVSEITELTAEERAAYIEDINHVAEALHQAFHPPFLSPEVLSVCRLSLSIVNLLAVPLLSAASALAVHVQSAFHAYGKRSEKPTVFRTR